MRGIERIDKQSDVYQLAYMPAQVKLEIFKWLPIAESTRCGQVCREWLQLSTDLSLWQFLAENFLHKTPDQRRLSIEEYKGNYPAYRRLLKEPYINQPLVFNSEIDWYNYHQQSLVLTSQGQVQCWDLSTKKQVPIEINAVDWTNFKLSADGKKIISVNVPRVPVNAQHEIQIWDIPTARLLNTLIGHTGLIRRCFLKQDKDKQQLISCADQIIKVWDLATNQSLDLLGHTALIQRLMITSDGKLVSASADGIIKIWDTTTHTCLLTLLKDKTPSEPIFLLENGQQLIAGYTSYKIGPDTYVGGKIKGWNLQTGIEEFDIAEAQNGFVNYLALTRSRKLISASLNGENQIKVWDLSTQTAYSLKTSHSSKLTAICLIKDLNLLVAAYGNEELTIWDLENGDHRSLPNPGGAVCSLYYFKGNLIINLMVGNTIHIYDFNKMTTEMS